MVLRYKPEIKTKYYGIAFEPETEAVMVESEQGTYVKLETYLDETKRLRAIIHRLETELSDIEAELYEARNDTSKDSGYYE